MARTKTNTRRSKAIPAQDRYAAELSAGQLVIGMSILLMICLASFLMGVVVGKFDPSLNPEIARESEPALDSASASIRQIAAVVEPAKTRDEPPPEIRVPIRTEPDAAAVGAPPPSSEDQAIASRPAATTLPDTSKPDDPILSSGAPSEALDEKVEKAEDAAASPTPERIQPAGILRTRFGVQVGAFQTQQRAEVSKRDLEAKSSYRADLVRSSSGRLVKVVVGSYADLQSANKVRGDLMQNFGYDDCFVTIWQ